MCHAWERREKCTMLWWESPKESDNSEDRGVDGIRMEIGGVCIGFSWLSIGTGIGLL
jgi:hypothetical protein